MEDFNRTNEILDFGVPEEKHSIIKVISACEELIAVDVFTIVRFISFSLFV